MVTLEVGYGVELVGPVVVRMGTIVKVCGALWGESDIVYYGARVVVVRYAFGGAYPQV